MTEASYTAWDDKQYVWPPPDGWYKASDHKWWPEGYGPPEAEPAAADAGPAGGTHDQDSEQSAASSSSASYDASDFSAGSDSGADTAARALNGVSDEAHSDDPLTDLSGGMDSSEPVDAAADAAATAVMSNDSLSESLSGPAGGFGSSLGGAMDSLTDRASDLADDARVSVSDLDGLPTSELGASDLGLDSATEKLSDLGDLPTPSPAGFDAPSLGDLSISDAGAAASGLGLDDAKDKLADEIPSIRDLASPDLDLSDLPSSDLPSSGLDEDATQVVPTDVAGQFADPLPAPAGTPTELDSGELPPPPGLAGTVREGADGAQGAPSFDASGFTDQAQAGGFDGPQVDAPQAGMPAPGAPIFDAPDQSAPSFGGAGYNPPSQGAPPDQAQFGSPVAQPQVLTQKKQGGSKGILFVVLGVLALAIIGGLLYWQFGRGDDSAEEAVAATGPGSVNDPHPRSTGVVVFYPDGEGDQRWVIEVLDPVSAGEPTSGDEVAAFTRVRVRNESGTDGASLSDLRFNAVTADGELIDREGSQCPSVVDDLNFSATVPVGGQVEGTVCWSIAADQLDGLKLGLESAKVAGRVHISLQ